MSRAREIAKTGGAIYNGTLGATTPASVAATTLSTTGAATFGGAVESTKFNTSADRAVLDAPAGDGRFRVSTNSTTYGFFRANTSVIQIGTDSVEPLDFHTNNVFRMRLDTSGNLGINVTPLSDLHILSNTVDSTNGIRLEYNTGTAYYSRIKQHGNDTHIMADTGNTGGTMRFFVGTDDHTTGSDMVLDASGNVGIGVANPTQPLTIQASSGAAAIALNGRSSDGISTLSLYANDGTTSQGYVQGRSDHLRVWAATGDFLSFGSGGSESMRISSGNLLVGTTDDAVWNNTAGNGINLRGDIGLIASARTNAESAMFNRMGTDGEVIKINKNGATVGSIGAQGGAPYISGPLAGGLKFSYLTSTNATIFPVTTTGAAADGLHDLGYVGSRFRGLYLSGGVYLGGTGAANHLDDYEEGTWTPIVVAYSGTQPTVSGSASGWYTKIGQLVTAHFSLNSIAVSGTTSGILEITGLPFTLSDEVAGTYTANQITLQRPDTSCVMALGSGLGILSQNNGGNWAWELVSIFDGNSALRATVSYRTTS